MPWTIMQYDYYHKDGIDILNGKHLPSKEEATKKLYEIFPDSKLEKIREKKVTFTDKGKILKYQEYYIGYYSGLIEGAILKIEKYK